MRKRIPKYCLAALVLIFLLLTAGCRDDVELKWVTGLGPGELFRVEDISCTEAEARLFLMNQKNRYEAAYGENIWKIPVEEESFAGYMKKKLEVFLSQLKCMVVMAQKRGIALSEEEKKQADAAAAEYLSSLKEDAAAYLGLSEKDLSRLYQEYRLAELLVSQVTAAAAGEISDDEARVIEVQQIIFPKVQQQEDGSLVPLMDSEMQALRARAEEAAGRAASGDSFANLQEVYSSEEAGSIQVSRYDVEEAWEQAVFALGSGEVSGVIETDTAFYVVRCISNLIPDLTAANKEVIRQRRSAELFYQEYNGFIKNLLILSDSESWKKFSFETEVPDTEADFYAIYDKYFS